MNDTFEKGPITRKRRSSISGAASASATLKRTHWKFAVGKNNKVSNVKKDCHRGSKESVHGPPHVTVAKDRGKNESRLFGKLR